MALLLVLRPLGVRVVPDILLPNLRPGPAHHRAAHALVGVDLKERVRVLVLLSLQANLQLADDPVVLHKVGVGRHNVLVCLGLVLSWERVPAGARLLNVRVVRGGVVARLLAPVLDPLDPLAEGIAAVRAPAVMLWRARACLGEAHDPAFNHRLTMRVWCRSRKETAIAMKQKERRGESSLYKPNAWAIAKPKTAEKNGTRTQVMSQPHVLLTPRKRVS